MIPRQKLDEDLTMKLVCSGDGRSFFDLSKVDEASFYFKGGAELVDVTAKT